MIEPVRFLVAGVVLILVSCASPPPPVEPVSLPVGNVELIHADTTPATEQLLDIGVRVFEAAPVDPVTAQVSPWLNQEIRNKETQFLPYVLRNTLAASNQWGSVRVLPQDDPSVDLTISGEILHSDGLTLVLNFKVRDSTGRLWLERQYRDETESRDFPVVRTTGRFQLDEALPEEDPFVDLYRQLANDLLALRQGLAGAQLETLRTVTRMRYAADLSPETFAGTLSRDGLGHWQVDRLLAEDDPMLRRVQEIKLRHFLFIDTVDQYYQALFADMKPPYDLWRRYSREQILEERERAGEASAGSRNFQALSQSYDRFRWARIFEQEFADLALGFNNEVAPAILELNRQVHGLSGSLEEQYVQWRQILRQLFELETGITR